MSDHDRPLNDRGRTNAPLMARNFAQSNVAVQHIISSTAVRTRCTAEAFGAALGLPVQLNTDLYASSASTLMHAAAASGGTSAMLVAHDPGISYLAERLSRGEISHMPTCAVATFNWQADDWSEATLDNAAEWRFSTPRSLRL